MSQQAHNSAPVRPKERNDVVPINPIFPVEAEGGAPDGVAVDAEAEGVEVLDGEGHWEDLPGGTAPRISRGPKEPSRIERERHEVTHLPPRSWCQHCRRGRSIHDRLTPCQGLAL